MSKKSKRTAFDGRATYQGECSDCKAVGYFTEPEFLDAVGPEVKAAADRNDSTAMSLALITRNATIGGGGGGSKGGPGSPQSALPSVRCESCKQPIPILKFRRKMLSSDKSRVLDGGGKDGDVGGDMSLAAEIVKLVEDVELEPEQDPLMLALMKVRRDLPDHNHWHGETGTMRVSSTLRWLVKPVMSFLRAIVLRNFDLEFIGSVSVFRSPATKKDNGKLTNLLNKMMPLALASDAPVSLIIVAIITGLPIVNFIVTFYLCGAASASSVVESDHDHHADIGSISSFIEHLARWPLTLLIWIGGVNVLLFMFWTIVREPGYLLPSEERRREMAEFVETKGQCDEDNAAELKKEKLAVEAHESSVGLADFGMIAQAMAVGAVGSPVAGVAAVAAAASGAGGASEQQQQQKAEPAAAAEETAISETPTFCSICKIQCPPRTYHCKLCNLCVTEHDHHCVIIGACVGKRNTVQFHRFLFFASASCFINFLQPLLFLLSTSSHVPILAYLLYFFFAGPMSLALAIWIGNLFIRHSHSFRTNRTAREMIAIMRQRQGKMVTREVRDKWMADMHRGWPGNPAKEVADENWNRITSRAVERSVFATSETTTHV